ncbi:MAG: HlyD family efflux transporter periplasmic adaptor subunit [Mastigocoleus sp. MO_167.B18]|nr:HlyD family efflux transporter periplasmic adaptor subunit [Mastigocoleus sp. MO_167.B18]
MLQNSNVESSSARKVSNIPILASIIAVLIAGGVSIYGIARFRASSTSISSETVPTQVEIKTVNALGRLEPKGETIKLSAPASLEGNRVEQLLVKRGDRIKVGQVVAILDSRDQLAATVEEAKHQVAIAQANLEKVKLGAKKGEIQAQQATINRLQAERETEIQAQQATINRLQAERETEIQAQQATIERLEAQLANAKTEYQRNQYLYQQGALSASSRDSKRLEYATVQKQVTEAKANLRRIESSKQQQLTEAQANLKRIQTSRKQQVIESRATLDRIAEVRPVDVAAAQAELNRVKASLVRAKANLRQSYVRSPQDGQVFEIYTRPGEIVSNNGIIEIGQNSQMYAVAEIYQSDIRKIRPGQKVKIFSDSLNGELAGTVELVGLQVKRQDVINADPSSNIDSRIVETRVKLDEESSKKAANFTNLQVRVEIQL